MKSESILWGKKSRHKPIFVVSISLFILFSAPVLADQNDSDHAAHHANQSPPAVPSNAPLAPLERALEKNPPPSQKKRKAKRSQSMTGMGSQGSTQPGPGMMGGAGGGMMGKDMTGHMNQMGQMMIQMGKPPGATMNTVPPTSELPGFPGASHIYHIGGTGFFLDHPDMISLTPEQQTALNRIKENSLSNEATSERKIDQAEQELWFLTSSDKPDISSIESKVKEIEVLKGDQRIAFIRSVGEAAKILTPDQRSVLLGRSSPPKQMTPNPSSDMTTPPMSQSSGMEPSENMAPPSPPSNNMGGKKGGMEGSMEPGEM